MNELLNEIRDRSEHSQSIVNAMLDCGTPLVQLQEKWYSPEELREIADAMQSLDPEEIDALSGKEA